MRFRVEQRYDAPLATVEEAFVDPAFIARLATLPKLGGAQMLERRDEGHLHHQRVRYAFVGELSAAVRAVVDPARLTWVEESTLDRRSHRTEWHVVPDHYGSLLRCSGTFQLEAEGPAATRREATGEVRVTFPLVGGRVEKAIVSGLEEHARLEAAAMAQWLRER